VHVVWRLSQFPPLRRITTNNDGTLSQAFQEDEIKHLAENGRPFAGGWLLTTLISSSKPISMA
jgi:hypothetical protein